MVAIESFKMLGKNKSIMMFPLLSMVFELLAVAVFLAGYFYVYGFGQEAIDALEKPGSSVLMYVFLFIFYIVGVFIVSFFQAGLVAVVSGQINGKKLSFNDGMNVAVAHSGKIFFWSFISATVGVVLQVIADKFKFIGRLVSNILGFAWNIITFFIVPVLVLENETVGGSIKRSGSVFKNKWGETLIANFSTGFFFGMMMVLGVVAFFVFVFLVGPETGLLIALAVALAFFMLAVAVMSAAVEGIYRVVIYEYAAHDKLPESFRRELIVDAIKTGK